MFPILQIRNLERYIYMKYSLLPILVFSAAIASCGGDSVQDYPDAVYKWTFDSARANVAQYVDPFIGTGGHGHTYPGATAPFGMVQLSPDTRIDGSWDGCSGYHHDDHRIYGFSHTHLSGTGCSDYGDIMLMPGHGELKFVPGSDSTEGYSTTFTHEQENADAGFYSVGLDNGVLCQLTASPRVGVHRYTFGEKENPWIILDMAHRDEVLECEIEIVDDHTIRGKRFSKAWATNQQLWFYAEFSEPFTHTFWSEGNSFKADSSTAKDLKAVFSFNAQQVEVKVALSPVSSNNAKMNLDVETGGMNFADVWNKTERHWNSELSCIEIETADETKKRIFYTALYHCFIAPNVYCDVNGEYQGMDHKVYRDTVHQRYTVFSLWDTYRALHPLFTIVQQKRTNDFINTFLQIYKESGRLPVWELSSNETDCMIGYHSVSVITDAWMKGITGFDTALAYEAMKASAMENRFGLEDYRKYGFIPAENESESVSRTLEYAYDDWCIAECAKRMHDSTGRKYFERRAENWKNMYNPATGFMQARLNNSFVEPFDPFEVNFHYTEANAWQYSMAVQQGPFQYAHVRGFQNFETHLDSLFHVSSKTAGRDQADITGLIGQYAHGNEPSHHMAYLYCGIMQPYKTQELVHQICNTLYTDKPDGLCGNEDCGQMSAWYVLSSVGFYQVTPGNPDYDLGSPQFPTTTFHLENGNNFKIWALDADQDYAYCSAVDRKSDMRFGHYILQHEEIMAGGELNVEKEDSARTGPGFIGHVIDEGDVCAPWITGVTSRTFTDRITIGMKSLFPSNRIYYSINNGEFKTYGSPITITENTVVRMYASNDAYTVTTEPVITAGTLTLRDVREKVGEITSDTIEAHFFKAPSWKSISIRNAFAPQYSAGGDRALIDGLTGTANFRTGLWQGYEGVDLDVLIDLGKSMNVDSVYVGFLEDRNSWIFSPLQIGVMVSDDSTSLSGSPKFYPIQNDGTISGPSLRRIGLKGGQGRYIRYVAVGQKVCPPGHLGAGKPAWLFADEITIKTK